MVAAAVAVSLASAPFMLGSAGALARAEEPISLQGKHLPEAGSLPRGDAALIPDAAGLPDAITPPMVPDASVPKPRPLEKPH